MTKSSEQIITITENILSTTRQVKLMEKKKFATITFDAEYKAFIVYIAAFTIDSNDKVHLSKKA